METFKAYLLILGFIGALGFGGYWAVVSLEDPVKIAENQDIRIVAQTPVSSVVNANVSETIDSEVLGEETSNQEAVVTTGNSNTTSENQTSTSSQYAGLISRLEGLVADNVLMKGGSRGTRVGTVQEFLNVYNGTNNRVDNDYGPGTETRVREFQRAQNLTADGQTGPNTYRKMIEWLQKN